LQGIGVQVRFLFLSRIKRATPRTSVKSAIVNSPSATLDRHPKYVSTSAQPAEQIQQSMSLAVAQTTLAYNAAKAEFDANMDAKTEELNTCKTKLMQLNATIAQLDAAHKEKIANIERVQELLNQTGGALGINTEARLNEQRAKVKDFSVQAEKMKQDMDKHEEADRAKSEELRRTISEKQDEAERLQDKIQKLELQAETVHRIKAKQSEVESKTDDIKHRLSLLMQKFEAIFTAENLPRMQAVVQAFDAHAGVKRTRLESLRLSH